MSSLVITIKSDKSSTQIVDALLTGVAGAHTAHRRLVNFLEAALGGLENVSTDWQYSSADPVAASQTITLSYADIANNDTVTVAGSVLTCVTGTPTTAQFKKQTSATVTASNLAAAINAHATISKYVSASSSGGVVTVTCLVKGEIGNLVTLATSNATGFVLGASALASGTGGATSSSPTNYKLGLA